MYVIILVFDNYDSPIIQCLIRYRRVADDEQSNMMSNPYFYPTLYQYISIVSNSQCL